jgi:hypothetical protein
MTLPPRSSVRTVTHDDSLRTVNRLLALGALLCLAAPLAGALVH